MSIERPTRRPEKFADAVDNPLALIELSAAAASGGGTLPDPAGDAFHGYGKAPGVQLIESARASWRALNAAHPLALVRAGARFKAGRGSTGRAIGPDP